MPVSWFTTLSGGAGGGGFGSKRATVALAAGNNNDLNPGGGWPTNYGRLILTAGAGAAVVTGLLAGVDNQLVEILSGEPAGGNNITLSALNVLSAAANQFRYSAGGIILPPLATAVALYDGSFALWVLR